MKELQAWLSPLSTILLIPAILCPPIILTDNITSDIICQVGRIKSSGEKMCNIELDLQHEIENIFGIQKMK